MSNYKVPKWRYEYGRTGKGLNLKMLSIEELLQSNEVIEDWIKPTQALHKAEWYKPIVNNSSEYQVLWLDCKRRINKLVKQADDKISHLEMDALNDEINRIFSDEGWRQIKKKMRQQTIRQQRSQVILSKEVSNRLAKFKQELNLDTFDEAVDYLLSEYQDKQTDEMSRLEIRDE
jgi:hypothetical protein